ncbi:MAG: CHAT domain-containing protein [Stigonema ocellatum SAG 48.90 = DSM 106950]|nr:CHAT domain-containing protein [Stigonema ocellatum SAG 48.90 = DSM 106950]
MPLTDNQCETLRDAILNAYPYQEKAALESLLNDKINVKLEFIVPYSDIISKDNLKKTTDTQKGNENGNVKILILKIPSKALDLDKELYEIEKAIKQAKNRELFNVTTKIVYSTDDIRRSIAEEKPQIVHFCSHGLTNGSLKLENSNDSEVSPESLKTIFEGREDVIKCVLLNACHSEKATGAIIQHINYAIGMNNEIIDGVAIEFAKGFYDGLGYNNDNDRYLVAFNEGIRAIVAENSLQKSVPVLKKRISYEEAILKLIKKINPEKIDYFIEKLIPELSLNNKLFNDFYYDYSYPIKKHELERLVEIVKEIENEDRNLVTSSYRDTLPENAMQDNSKLNSRQNIDNIINILCQQYPYVREVPSILEFAKNLASKFVDNSEQYKKIKSWVEEVSSKLSIPISIQPKVESRLQQIHTYLLIIVNEEDNNKFNLRAEYILEDENLTKIQQKSLNLPDHKQQPGIPCNSFNEIPHQINKYYDELFEQLSKNELKKITIELFLPMQYLRKNLDKEWFIYDDISLTTPIVREYNIVVRPSERLKKKFCIELENNFDRFKDSLKEYSDEDILNKEIEIINQKVVDSNFQKISDNFKDKKIGVKLTYNSIPETAFFRAIIRGAIGIAFWRRCSIPENSNFSDIDNHLKLEFFKNNFRNLIEKMYELRKEASYNDENFYPIGFLCDNPNRIPDSTFLKSF